MKESPSCTDPRARLAAWALAGAWLLAACAASPGRRVEPDAAPPAPGPSASASASVWQPTPDPPSLPATVGVRFVMEDRPGGERDLKVTLEGLDFSRVISRVAAEHRCGAEFTEEGSPDTELSVGCGMTPLASVSRHEKSIGVRLGRGDKDVLWFDIKSDTEVVFHQQIADPGRGRGCQANEAPKPLLIGAETGPLRPLAPGSSDTLMLYDFYLVVPGMKLRELVIQAAPHDHCRGHYSRSRDRYEAGCSSSDTSAELSARVEGDGLLFFSEFRDLGERTGKALGGFRMPCGAVPKFVTFQRVEPGYGTPGRRCQLQCEINQTPCHDRCELEHPPGYFTLEVSECEQRCRDLTERCGRRCPAN